MLKKFALSVFVAVAALWLGIGAAYLTGRASAPAATVSIPTVSVISFTSDVADGSHPDYPLVTARPRELPAQRAWAPLVRLTNVGVNSESAAAVARSIIALNFAGADYIVLEISSPGGEVEPGIELARVIEMSKAPVHCVVDGEAQSMATYILQSCDSRSITRRSWMMIHEPAIPVDGYERTLDTRNQLSHARHVVDAFLHQYRRLKVPFPELRRRVGDNQNWYLSADEALAAGAVDSIVDSVKQVRDGYARAARRLP